MSKIDFINIIETTKPMHTDVFLATACVERTKESCYWTFEIKNESDVIEFINLWNEHRESSDMLNKLNEFNLKIKDSSIQRLIDDYSKDNHVVFKEMKLDSYYDQYGKEHRILINQNFCPYSHFVLYHKDGTTNLTEYDGWTDLYFSPRRSFIVNENEDSELIDTYVTDEDDDFYYCKFIPIHLIYNGFTIQFENEYEHSEITIKIDKNTLKVLCDEHPSKFEDIYVKNFHLSQ